MPETLAETVDGDERQAMVVTLLPRHVAARLRAYCEAEGEQPIDVVADAIVLHLDALAGGDDLPAEPRVQ